jgi:lactate permease
VMAFSTMTTISGNILAPTSTTEFAQYNMNNILGATLAAAFGIGFIFVAPTLGLFGAVVGGSETGSNVMFLGIQQKASVNIGLKFDQFMTIYGAHAAAGGIASAITPAKINNATSTIGETSKLESEIMRKHMVIAIGLTIVVSMMTAAFVSIGL